MAAPVCRLPVLSQSLNVNGQDYNLCIRRQHLEGTRWSSSYIFFHVGMERYMRFKRVLEPPKVPSEGVSADALIAVANSLYQWSKLQFLYWKETRANRLWSSSYIYIFNVQS